MDFIKKSKEFAKVENPTEDREAFQKKIVELTNYDESLVPDYSLPSPLNKADGTKVSSAFEWANFQAPEIFSMFQKEMYGKVPPRPDSVSYELLSYCEDALGGTAIRKEVRIHFAMLNGKKHFIDMLLYAPKDAKESPAPVFLGLNFKGNHATTVEKDVLMTGSLANNPELLTEESRGTQDYRWEFTELIKNGFATATVCYHDIFPDNSSGWDKSILQLFEDLTDFSGSHPYYTSITAWAWGLSRMLDYLESDPLIDASRAAVHGHSRLGKTALWAGACDSRFRLVISNNSGCGGAALGKRFFGEQYLIMGSALPHWLVKSFKKYFANEENMPFDQHFLLALIAPRAIAIASATEDLWADPKGEFLSAKYCSEVYELFGSKGLNADEMPEAGTYHSSDVSYHLREGKHDQMPFDWKHYIKLGKRFLKK